MFVHSADKLAEMRTKFHVIQAKLIMSVWCFTVQCDVQAYYRGAQACVVAFSTTDRDSLAAVRKWRKKVEDECGDIPMVLVQNKIDLIAQSEINQ